jgi:Xaa-Pro aminopeptidase
MDVHDVNSISTATPLEPGMIVTIEPGIYIPDDPSIPERFRGIGIRIEDDILVTDSKPEILTKAAPKHIEEIERVMAK